MHEDSWFRSEPCQAHPIVSNLISDYVRYRAIEINLVVDLWASSSYLLQPLAEKLNTPSSQPVVAGISPAEHEDKVRTEDIGYLSPHPAGITAEWFPNPDLVVGIPPRRWKPKRTKRLNNDSQSVALTDDPANIALIDACQMLSPEGLGCFVVGPGLLMRPGPGTVMANLAKFGLFIDGIVVLPQGSTQPNIGAGQNLLVISRTQRTPQVLGRLSPECPNLKDIIKTSV
ncbi:hypothetical protein [Enteractinococcus fodinae]|uniref:DNA methylase adenine-specific domain-containing protein n=1 Tax=Enteractinococcus fodinae TaxID=684663 RepID=A0ABU2B2T9_9MICC|nr:hypothetical protein [Enteractinococcus fodinae]MDR7347923.1 hypothetical protein [Enteractinococcus fodinae]